MHGLHSSPHLAILLLLLLLIIIPALAIVSKPFSSSNCQPFIEAGTMNIFSASHTMCSNWTGKSILLPFSTAKSDTNYAILLSL